MVETPTEAELENELRELISQGYSLSKVIAFLTGAYPLKIKFTHTS